MYSVAAVLYLQSVLHVMLFPMLNMFCIFTSALPAVCSAQYGCFLQLFNFARSRYVAQVLSQPFSDCSSRTYYYRYHFCFYSPHALNFCRTVFIFQNPLSSSPDHISAPSSHNIHPLSIITHYAVQFTASDSSVSLHCSFHNMATVPSRPVYANFGTWPHCLTASISLLTWVRTVHMLYHHSSKPCVVVVTLHTAHYTLHTAHTAHYTLHITRCTLHTQHVRNSYLSTHNCVCILYFNIYSESCI